MSSYVLDPISTINSGLRQYQADVAHTMGQSYRLSKLPNIDYPAPTISNIHLAQAEGPLAFTEQTMRQRSSCTRPQTDRLPDRMASEYYPVPATLQTAVEPFPREGRQSRAEVKYSGERCQWSR